MGRTDCEGVRERSVGVLPAEERAGEVRILEALPKEQGDDPYGGPLHRPAAPDLDEGIAGLLFLRPERIFRDARG